MIARGGKSASIARLGGDSVPAAGSQQVQSVAGLMALVLTPLAPLLVRATLGIPARGRVRPRTGRREVVSRLSRGVLAPQRFSQRNPVAWTRRAEFVGWLLLPLMLGVFAATVPWPLRLLPVALGLLVLVPGYRAVREYLEEIPGVPGRTMRYGRQRLPRIETYMPPILLAPSAMALLLPAAAPLADTAFPTLAALLLCALVALPFVAHPTRPLPYWKSPRADPARLGPPPGLPRRLASPRPAFTARGPLRKTLKPANRRRSTPRTVPRIPYAPRPAGSPFIALARRAAA
jgi:hypothetical protein